VKHILTPNSEQLGVNAVFPRRKGFHVSILKTVSVSMSFVISYGECTVEVVLYT
jgi:hypothetical protein